MIINIKGYDVQIDEEDWDKVSQYRWSVHTTSIKRNRQVYFIANVVINTKHTTIPLHRFIHFGVIDIQNNKLVDHINRDTLDNRKCNLRLVSSAENSWNKGRMQQSSSPYKGVLWYKRGNKWTAAIYTKLENGKTVRLHLGYFTSPEEAAKVYDRKAISMRGEYAYTNFPRENYIKEQQDGNIN